MLRHSARPRLSISVDQNISVICICVRRKTCVKRMWFYGARERKCPMGYAGGDEIAFRKQQEDGHVLGPQRDKLYRSGTGAVSWTCCGGRASSTRVRRVVVEQWEMKPLPRAIHIRLWFYSAAFVQHSPPLSIIRCLLSILANVHDVLDSPTFLQKSPPQHSQFPVAPGTSRWQLQRHFGVLTSLLVL